MKIIEEILGTIDFQASVRDIRQGPFQTAVLTRQCGLASTPHDAGPHHDRNPVSNAGRLLEQDTESLARLALSESENEAAIGMATVNSLIKVDQSRCEDINAAELLMARGEGKQVAIIGHFPFIPRLKKIAGELHVIERNPREDDLEEAEAENILPQSEVIGITGTAFTNHTIEHLLELCRSDAYIVVLGGTAPLSPILFDHSISAVAGTLVIDQDTVLRGVNQGATYRQLNGVRKIIMKKDIG